MVSTFIELLKQAGKHRDADMPVVYVLGNLDKHAEADTVVMTHVGRINSTPVFKLQPRIWEITENEGIKVCDDYTDWMELNDETVVFPPESIECAIVANPANDNFATSPSSWKFVTYPPVTHK